MKVRCGKGQAVFLGLIILDRAKPIIGWVLLDL